MLGELRTKASVFSNRHESLRKKALKENWKTTTVVDENNKSTPSTVGQTKPQRSVRRKWLLVGAAYLAWQVGFSIAVSPLGFKILTAEQMGFTLSTLPLGLLVAGVILAMATGVSLTNAQVAAYAKGFSNVKTREQFDTAWAMTLRGSDDGFIAETHWSGAVLPLLIMAFTLIGIPFLVSAGLALVARIFLHAGAHLFFPREEYGQRVFGGMWFVLRGLALQDSMNAIAFLISGNIITPILLHHISAYIPTVFGVKEKVAKKLGFGPPGSTSKLTNA